MTSSFNSYSSGTFISLISYSFSAYKFVIVNFPSADVTPVFASPFTSSPFSFVVISVMLYVAPGTNLSFPVWYFTKSKSYFSAILNPILFGSVCVLYFPSFVSKQKYTPWWLYATLLNSNPFGTFTV